MFVLLFYTVGQRHSLPPGGRGTTLTPGGRSPRYFEISNIFLVTRSPSPDSVGSSLPEGAFGLCAPKACLLFLTSTAFVGTKAKPRIRRGKFYLIRLFLKFKYSSSLSKKLSYLGNSLSKYIVVINSSCVLKSSIVEKYIGFLKLI